MAEESRKPGAPQEGAPVTENRSGPLHDGTRSAPRWLLQQRMTVSELPGDYCDRAELTGRCAPPGSRITLVMAPGGFGKTTLLAATCRAVRGEGVPVAWLSLASVGGPAELDAYLAWAFRWAGIDVPVELPAGTWRNASPHAGTAALVCALQARAAPCMLALDELERCYRSARRVARVRFPEHPRPNAIGAVLARELALERNRVGSEPEEERLAQEVHAYGANLGVRAAASDVAVELARERVGTDHALGTLDGMWERARADGLVALERHLAGLRVALLVEGGRVGEADRTWRAAELPADDRGCLDLDLRGWRETEAVSCARLRLLAAPHEYAAARHGLRRTQLRALALSVAFEHDAGAPDAAVKRLVDYLRLYIEADFARPLVRVGEPGGASLERFLDAQPATVLAQAAEGLLAMVQGGGAVAVRRFRGAQKKVLLGLATQRDKDIAAALGLSTHGVRYHIRNIFRKLEVGDRAAVVQRARALGLLPPAP